MASDNVPNPQSINEDAGETKDPVFPIGIDDPLVYEAFHPAGPDDANKPLSSIRAAGQVIEDAVQGAVNTAVDEAKNHPGRFALEAGGAIALGVAATASSPIIAGGAALVGAGEATVAGAAAVGTAVEGLASITLGVGTIKGGVAAVNDTKEGLDKSQKDIEVVTHPEKHTPEEIVQANKNIEANLGPGALEAILTTGGAAVAGGNAARLLGKVSIIGKAEEGLSLSTSERTAFSDLGIRKTQSIKRVINTMGRPADEALYEAVRSNRVVAVGEKHWEQLDWHQRWVKDNLPQLHHPEEFVNPMKEWAAQQMPQLRDAGITHLCIEHDSEDRSFFATKQPKEIENFPPNSGRNFLQSAWDSGIQIVPVDNRWFWAVAKEERLMAELDRDKHMADNVMAILDADPHNKVLLWLGAAHVGRGHYDIADASFIKTASNHIQRLLQERGLTQGLATFSGELDGRTQDFDVTAPIAVPTHTQGKPNALGRLQMGDPGGNDPFFNHSPTRSNFDRYDYVFVFPRP